MLLVLYDRLTTDQALTFLTAWAEEGISVSVLALRCGVRPATVSRHLRDLSSRVINNEPGLEPLEITDRQVPRDFRLRHVYLTERGHRLAKRSVEVLDDNLEEK